MALEKEGRGWDSGDRKKKRRCYGKCCAWASLVAGCFVFVIILMGALLLYFIQKALPELHLRRLNISRFDVANHHDRTLLTADVRLMFNATNRYSLSYKSLEVDVSSYHVNLGSTKIAPFKHNAGEMTLEVHTSVKGYPVSSDDGQGLKEDYKTKDVTISAVFHGKIDVDFGGYKLNDVPFQIFCMDIEQIDIDSGKKPKCNSKMFKLI